MTPRNPLGRPRLGPRYTVQARVSEHERTAFERCALDCGYELSEWIRRALRSAAGLQEPEARVTSDIDDTGV